MSVSWIVVFLGNPGTRYAQTRHNAGFMTADALEQKKNIRIDRLRFRALTTQCELGGHAALLIKPQTYMNLSGLSVAPAAAYYKTPPERVLVVSDDVSLPPGKLRIRGSGSSGGHKGLKNIIECLGTQDFPRIKIGIGSPSNPDYEMMDWVTGGISQKEAEFLRKAAETAANVLETYIRDGIDTTISIE